jgi:dTDP-4-dehydrorhamnose 3,5-epimerase
MKVSATSIEGVMLIEPRVFADDRGFFMETWNSEAYVAAGLHATFVQDNYSHSRRGTLRGLHFQIAQPQGKLVGVRAGAVFDVVVDLRRTSPSFGQWYGIELSAQNRRQLWVPIGLAHGFYVLSDAADFAYKCTDYYAPQHERTLLWNDATVGVQWPLLADTELLLSGKDATGTRFDSLELFE